MPDQATAALVAAFRAALRAWRSSPAAREAAATFGMDERAYCHRHVTTHWRPWTFTTTTTAPPHTPDWGACYAEARRAEGDA